MRKGEKLYMFLMDRMDKLPDQEHYKSMSPSSIYAEQYYTVLDSLNEINDEELDKILNS